MPIDIRTFRRSSGPQEPARPELPVGPPPLRDLLVFGVGNSGESTALRCQALALADGTAITAAGINNDALGPRALQVRQPDGSLVAVTPGERLVLGAGNPRERLSDFPLLAARYQPLLRGIPVLETYARAGYGGNGHPAISALDLDLNVGEVVSFCRRAIRSLAGDEGPGTSSDMRRLLHERRWRVERQSRLLRIAVVGGGAGSMGNAAHHLLPYLLRHLLQDLGVPAYELWGFVLGPKAFTGLTPFIAHNYRALLESLEHLARHGQRRGRRCGSTARSNCASAAPRRAAARPPQEAGDDPAYPQHHGRRLVWSGVCSRRRPSACCWRCSPSRSGRRACAACDRRGPPAAVWRACSSCWRSCWRRALCPSAPSSRP